MSTLGDQFDQGRIPLKPLPYKNKSLAQRSELMIDYVGEHPNYHIYIVDPNDETKIIDITAYMVKEAFGNSITINIDGVDEPITLHDLLNFIYKRFTYPDDPNGFNYDRDRQKVIDPSTKVVLLRDIDGIYYLPITRFDCVFDKDGNSIEERLDNMTRLGFSNDYIQVEADGQNVFEITYPYLNYTQHGNYFELRIGTVYVDKTRYQVIDNKDEDGNVYGATITFFNDRFEKDRRIDILYIYNTANNVSLRSVISGGDIAYNSISSSKLEKVTDKYTVPDSTAIASAKAVYDLYHDFIGAISEANGSSVYVNDNSTDPRMIAIDLSNDNITLGDKLIVANIYIANAKNATCKLSVDYPDGNEKKTVHFDLNTSSGIGAGRLLSILINKNSMKVLQANEIKNNITRYIYTCKDQEYTIPYSNLSYSEISTIRVYRNGVRLFEDLDYRDDRSKQTITLFVRTEEGERIVFEAETIQF